MPIRIPYIPRTITVHMGLPSRWAEDVTVTFPDYVKNVACSEIYPTWEENAIRANILAIISFALNRVYTEFYPSQGYSFNITSTTNFDQKFIKGRTIFDNVSRIVDELFNDYMRRQGFVEPLAANFCNGTTVTCPGLSQWGSQGLAEDGFSTVDILKYYYGREIELVVDAPIRNIEESYPGSPLRLGDVGEDVVVIQESLNRISQDYPAIPKISPAIGVFNESTQAAVKKFQSVFKLTSDGIVGKATWYKLVYLFVGISDLSELVSEGQRLSRTRFRFPGTLREGNREDGVVVLQYMLSLLDRFYPDLPPLSQDGVFGPRTTAAVIAFQRKEGLVPDGVVGVTTWNAIYEAFVSIDLTLRNDSVGFPYSGGLAASTGGYDQTTRLGQYPGQPLQRGDSDRKDVTLV